MATLGAEGSRNFAPRCILSPLKNDGRIRPSGECFADNVRKAPHVINGEFGSLVKNARFWHVTDPERNQVELVCYDASV